MAANAVAAFDLADDEQMLVVNDHDSRVPARRKPWQLGRRWNERAAGP